ncbi:MAG: hypothetical protein ACK53A_16655 [Gemmatimonadota bacterium]|jgi:antibiotic biosynthesis monooxygenase (ABM) superfamily enzyme|nr:hypothetical protein [Gemmatimonadota bacterium]
MAPGPVTVVVTRHVKPRREPDYEAWLARLLRDAATHLRMAVHMIIVVALKTWVLMPRLTRWMARWIYPTSRAVT